MDNEINEVIHSYIILELEYYNGIQDIFSNNLILKSDENKIYLGLNCIIINKKVLTNCYYLKKYLKNNINVSDNNLDLIFEFITNNIKFKLFFQKNMYPITINKIINNEIISKLFNKTFKNIDNDEIYYSSLFLLFDINSNADFNKLATNNIFHINKKDEFINEKYYITTSNYSIYSDDIFYSQRFKINKIIETNDSDLIAIFENNNYDEINFSIISDRTNTFLYLLLSINTKNYCNIIIGINSGYLLNSLFNLNVKIFKDININNKILFWKNRVVYLKYNDQSFTGVYITNGIIISNAHPFEAENIFSIKKTGEGHFFNNTKINYEVLFIPSNNLDISILRIISNSSNYITQLSSNFDYNLKYFYDYTLIKKTSTTVFVIGYNINSDNLHYPFIIKCKIIKSICFNGIEYFILLKGIINNGNSGSVVIDKYGNFTGIIYANIYKQKYNNYILCVSKELLKLLIINLSLNKNVNLNYLNNYNKEFITSIKNLYNNKLIPKF